MPNSLTSEVEPSAMAVISTVPRCCFSCPGPSATLFSWMSISEIEIFSLQSSGRSLQNKRLAKNKKQTPVKQKQEHTLDRCRIHFT